MTTKRIDETVAADVMTKTLVCATPNQLLADVDRQLIENRISGMPVVFGGKLVGVISRSDIARVQVLMQSLDGEISDEWRYDAMQADGFQHPENARFQGFEERLAKLTVRDAMRGQVITCTPDTRISEVAQNMVRQHIHRVIVVEGERAVGVVSSLDIVKLVAKGISS